MGCDIHMYVEYKYEENWFSGDYFKLNKYHPAYPESEPEYNKIGLCEDRSYSLFSFLAGVRDYSNKIIPVAQPKGLPVDCCKFVKEENERWDVDGHTHSWLTLYEIREHAKTHTTITHSGLIHVSQAKKLDIEGITPESWCQGTNQPDYVHREWTEPTTILQPLIEKLQQRANETLQYEWQDYNPENDHLIRIVFWFDN